MKDALLNLLKVKSIITIVCLGLFVYVVIKGIVDGDYFKTIFTMIISFYFGTQVQKAATAVQGLQEKVEGAKED